MWAVSPPAQPGGWQRGSRAGVGQSQCPSLPPTPIYKARAHKVLLKAGILHRIISFFRVVCDPSPLQAIGTLAVSAFSDHMLPHGPQGSAQTKAWWCLQRFGESQTHQTQTTVPGAASLDLAGSALALKGSYGVQLT